MIENYGILGWIVIGLLAGGVAKLLMPGKDPGGCLITILLGLAGALLAGLSAAATGGVSGFSGSSATYAHSSAPFCQA